MFTRDFFVAAHSLADTTTRPREHSRGSCACGEAVMPPGCVQENQRVRAGGRAVRDITDVRAFDEMTSRPCAVSI